jgi:AraC-like DNA-binding protein
MSLPDTSDSLIAKIRGMIRPNVSSQFPDFEAIADTLHFTPITLRRRLRAEGSSYQQIKDDIRRDTAIYNLSKAVMSIEQVAESVGFTEATSFYRAFKRWTGATPRDYISKDSATRTSAV